VIALQRGGRTVVVGRSIRSVADKELVDGKDLENAGVKAELG
jgi:hypothetical protein